MRRIPRETIGLAVAALLLILAAPAHAADDPEIAVEASANEIYIGESIDYVVEIRNVKNPVCARPLGLASRFRRSFPTATSRIINRRRSSSTAG